MVLSFSVMDARDANVQESYSAARQDANAVLRQAQPVAKEERFTRLRHELAALIEGHAECVNEAGDVVDCSLFTELVKLYSDHFPESL